MPQMETSRWLKWTVIQRSDPCDSWYLIKVCVKSVRSVTLGFTGPPGPSTVWPTLILQEALFGKSTPPCAVQTRSEFYDVNYVLWMWTELHYKVHLLSIKAMWSLGSVSENGLLTKFKSIYISSACVQTTIDRSHSKSATTFMSTSLLKLKRDAK